MLNLSRTAFFAWLATTLTCGLSVAQGELLYYSDFETDGGGFVPNGDWASGIPTSGPGAAHAGLRCWGTNLDGPATVGMISYLTSPVIDATPALSGDGILVSWWQYIDDVGIHVSIVTARSGGAATQQVFGLARINGSTDPRHTGWKQFQVVLDREYATTDLTLEFRFEAAGGGSDGKYIDEVSVAVVRTTTVSLDDFEAGKGGFKPHGAWAYGAPSSCPVPVSPASGVLCWGISLDCAYPPLANDGFVSPTVDLTPFANRREVYLRWNRFVALESLFDGLHHEVSFDGGTSWEHGAGFHSHASDGLFGWTGFGLAFDPAGKSSVKLRQRLTSDLVDEEYGAWFDDFELAVPEIVPGNLANPPGSLQVPAGSFGLGQLVTLDIQDPSGSFAPGALGLLLFAFESDANLPGGTPLPGWGMSAPGAVGDLLVDLSTLAAVEVGPAWFPGQPSRIMLQLPSAGALAGTDLWLQGVLVDVAGGAGRVGLTNGLFERL